MKNPNLTFLIIATALLLVAGVTFREARPYRSPSYWVSEINADSETTIVPSIEPSNPAQKESCKPAQKHRKPRFPLVASRPMWEWDLAALQTG